LLEHGHFLRSGEIDQEVEIAVPPEVRVRDDWASKGQQEIAVVDRKGQRYSIALETAFPFCMVNALANAYKGETQLSRDFVGKTA
jgi:hypothetical protein